MLLALALCLGLAAPAYASSGDFIIEDGVLYGYNGPGGDVVIPEGVTTIWGYAFQSCFNLTSVTIPDSVTTIGEYAFSECTRLTDVYYTGSRAQWDAIEIGPENVKLENADIHYKSGGFPVVLVVVIAVVVLAAAIVAVALVLRKKKAAPVPAGRIPVPMGQVPGPMGQAPAPGSCPNCGKPLAPGARFCTACGHKLTDGR